MRLEKIEDAFIYITEYLRLVKDLQKAESINSLVVCENGVPIKFECLRGDGRAESELSPFLELSKQAIIDKLKQGIDCYEKRIESL
jgi:hypothetical protein